MAQKYTDFEISDEALSRQFWRKALSTNDERTQSEIQKEIFSHYQRNIEQNDIENCTFPAYIHNEQLRKALIAITAKQRKVIELYYFNDMTQADIAEYLHCAQSTVSEKLDCGMRKLLQILSKAK